MSGADARSQRKIQEWERAITLENVFLKKNHGALCQSG